MGDIIKSFDDFKGVNEGQTLLSFLAKQIGPQAAKAMKERILVMLLERMGVPAESDHPGSKFFKEVAIKTLAGLTAGEMDNILKGETKIDDKKFWVGRISKAFQETTLKYVTSSDVVSFCGVDPDGFIGRLIENAYRSTIEDLSKIEEFLEGIWDLVTNEEFIPKKTAQQIYQEELDKLPGNQKKAAEKSIFGAAAKQMARLKSN